MKQVELTDLIKAGAHFGHLTRRWNPKMKPYIFTEKNGIHLIDLKKTQSMLTEAAEKLHEIASIGGKILFVGTKKQAKSIIESEARRIEMHWVSERWLGGMLTNFKTVKRSVKRLQTIERQETDGTFDKITKKERLFLTREKDKLKKVLEGIERLQGLPAALFIVDIKKEAIAVKEARRLNIPVFAIVDTNCDPDPIDFVIPANDDAVKTIEYIVSYISEIVQEGAIKAKELRVEEEATNERRLKERGREGNDNEKRPNRKPKPRIRKPHAEQPATEAPASATVVVEEAPAAKTEEPTAE